MNSFSGYNQIKMTKKDNKKTTFVTHWGTFYYKVMPFMLKNVGAIYQWTITTLFNETMHKEIEVYVDDMITKFKKKKDHVQNLGKLFERLRKYQLKLNLSKCIFGVKSRKLLGFVTSNRGIKLDLDKIKAIQATPVLKIKKEMRSLFGHLSYIVLHF
jgi:hypothetical protein